MRPVRLVPFSKADSTRPTPCGRPHVPDCAPRGCWCHNVEVVPRLQRKIRDPRCSYERSLDTLRQAKELADTLTKSSLMVGLGETREEVLEALELLRAADVDFVTIGQYLRPGHEYAPVREYVEPAQFADYQVRGEKMGFSYVAAGPLVRSSYKAGEFFFERMVRERGVV